MRGDVLTLVSAGTKITMQDKQTVTPAVPLVMTEWQFDTIVEGDVASNVQTGVTAQLSVGSGRSKAFVQTGCNTGTGEVEIRPATLTFGPIALTKRACLNPSAVSVESAFVSVLQGDVEYAVAGRVLTLTNGDRCLTFRAP